ncbi:transcriptional regulator [Pantoea dispersa]|nr:transcriptional regulator [Pantoea dispersa]UYP74523.1 transcriptional regulator [Pantoea dispersa]
MNKIKRVAISAFFVVFSSVMSSGCIPIINTAKNIKNNTLTLSDHARAVSAMDNGDLKSAEGFLTGNLYPHRYRPISGAESWGSLQYRAAKIVATAKDNGRTVQNDALYLSYLSLFNAEEGLPEHPEIMLGYMHKAMAMLLADPHLLDHVNSAHASELPSQFELERYAIWQYLSDGGEVNWKKTNANGQGRYIAGISYREWNIRLRKAIWNRGDKFLSNIGKAQFISESIDYSLFPVVVCVSRLKGWSLTLPDNYPKQNFRGGGDFDWKTCKNI